MNIYKKHKVPELLAKLKLPDGINEYFVKSGDTDLKQDKPTVEYFSNNILPRVKQFTFSQTTGGDVPKTSCSMKSQAILISMSVLTYAFPVISPYFQHIFNFCIFNKVFLTLWEKF